MEDNNEETIQEELKDKEEKEKKLDTKDMVPKKDYDELEDRYKRVFAEFENFKKRSRRVCKVRV